MNAPISAFLAALLVGAATAALAQDPAPVAAGDTLDPVYVDATEIRYLESSPVQVQLVVRGDLPTPCHEAAYEVQDTGPSVDVRIWSLADAGAFCVQVLEPFELVIPLGSFDSADLPVILDGQQIGRIEIDPVQGPPALVGAGWSFGHCLGSCAADLVIDGDEVSLTGRDQAAEAALVSNRGRLTPEGRARLDAALATLGSSALDPVYGCPDCLDGGAAYLDIDRAGVAERVTMEYDDPPDVLAELYAVAMALSDGLQDCVASDLLEPADDCLPYVRD